MAGSDRGQGAFRIQLHSPSYQTPTRHCHRHLGPPGHRELVWPQPSSPVDSAEGRGQPDLIPNLGWPCGQVLWGVEGSSREPREAGTLERLFCQITVGAGSPEMGTSSRSLFPATTTIVSVRPGQSRWILGGSVSRQLQSGEPKGWAHQEGAWVTLAGNAGSACPGGWFFKNQLHGGMISTHWFVFGFVLR